MIVVVVVFCLLVEAGLGYMLWRQLQRVRSHRVALVAVDYCLAERDRISQARADLETSRQRVEETVDWTTESVETIHRMISDLSFDLTGQRAGPARTIHDHTSERIYSGIRGVNRGVGSFLSGLLDERPRDRDN